jgi:hypothetical protein
LLPFEILEENILYFPSSPPARESDAGAGERNTLYFLPRSWRKMALPEYFIDIPMTITIIGSAGSFSGSFFYLYFLTPKSAIAARRYRFQRRGGRYVTGHKFNGFM